MASNDVAAADVICFGSIDSTNEEALRRARAGYREPLWLRADLQTSGRGRLGRRWTSPTGNLHASLLLHAPAEARYLPQLAHVAAVALVEAIHETIGTGSPIVLKWPNDLLLGRAKVAGILVEGSRGCDGQAVCVIGWGVNCSFHPDDLPYPTTDLTTATGRRVEAAAVFAALRPAMAKVLAQWDGGRGYPVIRALWLQHALPIGTQLTVGTAGSKRHGLFEGIDLEGRLLIREPAGLATIEAGDVILDDRSAGSG